jgi:hypothetical protein
VEWNGKTVMQTITVFEKLVFITNSGILV